MPPEGPESAEGDQYPVPSRYGVLFPTCISVSMVANVGDIATSSRNTPAAFQLLRAASPPAQPDSQTEP
jgi:hypothetical protein